MANSQAPTSSDGVLHDENVLETLASIKSQVSNVLLHLQQSKISATASAGNAQQSVSLMDPPQATAKPSTTKGQGPPPGTPGIDTPLSRDEVKAQREAAKAAKAARKNKSLAKPDAQPNSPRPDIAPKAPVQSSENQPPKPSKSKQKEKAAKTESPKASTSTTAKTDVPQPPTPVPVVTDASAPNKSASPVAKAEAIATPPESGSTTAPAGTESKKSDATGSPKKGSPVAAPKLSPEEQENRARIERLQSVFEELGFKYQDRIILGSNQRTMALLNAVKIYVENYRIPDGKEFKQDISVQLKYSLDKLKQCRPFAIGMTSAIDGLNGHIRHLKDEYSESECQESLMDWCDTFINEKIHQGVRAIAFKGCEKIEEGDTILIFSLTEVVHQVLKCAGATEKKFKLIFAIANNDLYIHDYNLMRNNFGVEKFEENVEFSCINVSSVMAYISSVDKVFLGGHALFTTGGVMAKAGSSMISLCANQHNVPVIFFCETYKFCDKSPMDAFYSEVFPENFFGFSSEKDTSIPVDKYANIRYDVTPVNLVTCVITDIDMLPSSSVPVVLRVQETRPLTKCS